MWNKMWMNIGVLTEVLPFGGGPNIWRTWWGWHDWWIFSLCYGWFDVRIAWTVRGSSLILVGVGGGGSRV